MEYARNRHTPSLFERITKVSVERNLFENSDYSSIHKG